ncbi:MAG TPA: EamA family transporter [Gaiellaceae bacterium]|nr:EamA family transporter [Gaiellaceae bacterium]
MTAVVLALAASVSWGVGDFLGGIGSRRASTLAVLAVSQAVGLVGIAVVVVATGRAPFGPAAAAAAVAAGVAGVVGLGALYRGFAVGAMGVVAPIAASAAVVPVVYGLARGERPGELQLAGMAAALAGVVLASREPGPVGRRVAAGVGLALVAAVGFGGYIVAIDAAAAADPLWAVLVARAVSSALAVAVATARRSVLLPRRLLPLGGAIGILDVGANVLLVLALTRGYVSVVSVLASLFPVVTVGLAAVVLGERLARTQALGAALALLGVALIASG